MNTPGRCLRLGVYAYAGLVVESWRSPPRFVIDNVRKSTPTTPPPPPPVQMRAVDREHISLPLAPAYLAHACNAMQCNAMHCYATRAFPLSVTHNSARENEAKGKNTHFDFICDKAKKACTRYLSANPFSVVTYVYYDEKKHRFYVCQMHTQAKHTTPAPPSLFPPFGRSAAGGER